MSDQAPANLAEAYAVVRFIRQAWRSRTCLFPRGGAVPAAYDDFAVLLRSTGNQIHYERMFRHFGVPYRTDNLRSLFTEAPINDFYLLLQLAVYPEDRAAYAGVLRSPFVNISDETLIRLLLQRCRRGSLRRIRRCRDSGKDLRRCRGVGRSTSRCGRPWTGCQLPRSFTAFGTASATATPFSETPKITTSSSTTII